MTKSEKEFRKALKEVYFDYLMLKNMDDATYWFRKYSIYCEVAERCFPKINISLCESRWWNEFYRKGV